MLPLLVPGRSFILSLPSTLPQSFLSLGPRLAVFHLELSSVLRFRSKVKQVALAFR